MEWSAKALLSSTHNGQTQWNSARARLKLNLYDYKVFKIVWIFSWLSSSLVSIERIVTLRRDVYYDCNHCGKNLTLKSNHDQY